MAYIQKQGIVARRARRMVTRRRRGFGADAEDDPSWFNTDTSSGSAGVAQGAINGVLNDFGGALGSSIVGLSSAMDTIDNGIRKYGNSMNQTCIDQANQYTAKLDAQWYKLAQSWQPTGVYVPSDVNTIVGAVSNIMIQAKLKVMFAPWPSADASAQIQQSIKDVDKKIVDGARFQNAAAQAAQQNGVVNAPDLKDWVVSSMVAASNTFATAFFMSCDVTWLEQMLSNVNDAIGTVTHIIGVVLDTALAAGESIVNTAKGAFDALAFITSNAKWIILGVGGYIGYRMIQKRT